MGRRYDVYQRGEIAYKVIILILDIPIGMYMQKYILLFSVVQSKSTHTLATCDQATGFSSKSHHQAAHTSTSYGLMPFVFFILTFLYLYVFYILHPLYLHFNINFS
jgi:hypothetical protein